MCMQTKLRAKIMSQVYRNKIGKAKKNLKRKWQFSLNNSLDVLSISFFRGWEIIFLLKITGREDKDTCTTIKS